MLPDTPENLMQIIGIAYAVPMDFYWRDLLYIAERVFFRSVPFKYFIPKEYLNCIIITLETMQICGSGAGTTAIQNF